MTSTRVSLHRSWLFAAAMVFVSVAPAAAEIYINEIYLDPPGSFAEAPLEYVELRGTPGMSLANHFLILVENEGALDDPITSSTGIIENIFDLSAHSLGSNGFMVIRRDGNPFSLAPETTEVIVNNPELENSGFTAMLIDKGAGVAPTLGLDLDGSVDNDSNPATNNDGLDFPTGQEGWSIVDSIGFFSEENEAPLGRTYAQLNFGPEPIGKPLPPSQGGGTFAPRLEPGAVYIGLGYEIEYLARYGDSTGQAAEDWHISNLTDNSLAGFVDAADGFRQAGGDPHGMPRPDGDEVESNQYVPYGTNMNDTLGASNYPLNQALLPWDFNENGVVDAADYTIWRDSQGEIDPSGDTLAANADGDGSVDQGDYDAWKFHFGESLPSAAGASDTSSVPEPATWLLTVLAAAMGVFADRSRMW